MAWLIATILALFLANNARAAEGAASNYFPGAYGNLLVAVAPEPGPVAVSLNLFFKGKTDFAVRQGRIDTGLTATAFYTLAQGLYVWDAPDAGGRFAFGGYVPYGYSRVKGDITGRLAAVRFDKDIDGLGDIGVIPVSYYWNNGNFHFNIYELVIAPTGKYELEDKVFVGRNYWSFDTVLAATWFEPNTGTELSAAGGIMV
ncbi:MAG: SphA family protein, partial [Hyphomicrobiales bacterium]